MKQRVFFFSLAIVALIAACTPAQSASGKFNGTYTSDSLPVTSGSGILTIEPDGADLINFHFTSTGNPDINLTGVTVNQQTVYNYTYYQYMYDAGSTYVSGVFHPADNHTEFYYENGTLDFNFDGTK